MSPKAKYVPDIIKIEIPKTAITCPHCKSKSHFKEMASCFFFEDGVWAVLLCDNCTKPIFSIYSWNGSYTVSPGYGVPSLEAKPSKTYPMMIPDVHPSTPKSVGDDYTESIVCYNAEAWKAAVVLCRRALQCSLVDKGANASKRLRDQIDDLARNQTITTEIRDWAHQIRYLGNDGAHPYDKGSLTRVSRDDADEILKFMESYLKYVYEMPYELAKMNRK